MKRKFQVIAIAALFIIPWGASAQDKPVVQPADYGQWESLGAPTLSSDGGWLAYLVRRVNEENELRIRNLGRDSTRVVAYGTAPRFANNSRWLAYAVGVSSDERERLTSQEEPVRNKLEILNLASGEELVIEDIASFSFSEDGAYLAARGYPPEGGPRGVADLLIRDLEGGTTSNFGNVSSYAWSDIGSVLAMTITTETGTGNGVHVYDPATASLRVLESSTATYRGLAWREDENDLAVLRSVEDEGFDEDTHVILLWTDIGSSRQAEQVFDPSEAAEFPEAIRIAEQRNLEWADDGSALYFGLRPREKSPEEEPEEETTEADTTDTAPDTKEEEQSDVQIWHAADYRIMPMQRAQEQRDLQRTMLAVWHIDSGRFVQVGTDLMETTRIVPGDRFATETENELYAFETMFGRTYNDIHLVDLQSGERRMVIPRVRHFYGGSPEGRYLLYFKGRDFWLYDLAADEHRKLTENVPTVFANVEYDCPVEQYPPRGLAGWTAGGRSLLVYDKYDIWSLEPDGSNARRLTDGADEQVIHRYLRLDREAESIDPDEPLYLRLSGEWTKKTGFSRMRIGRTPERLVFEDRFVGGLTRAENADVFVYGKQSFDDSPDYFTAGPDLAQATQVTESNPFQQDFAWGRSELVDFESTTGRKLQAALLYPPNYDASRQYPMIVYTYEILSSSVHRYVAPSERSYYNNAVFTNNGYFVLLPDIVYRGRDPGRSAVEAVEGAVKAIVDRGIVDPERVGLVGHSWGGYQATYIPTQTDIFAASVAGAPITNFLSFMGAIHWRPGLPETGHWETGQARMGVPFWEDFDAHRNSPAAFVHELNTPMMMMFGDDDGTVDWRQGQEFYNYARRAGKTDFVLLVYPGEDHGLRQKQNQIDYQRRILQWFGHYLKGEPAPEWMTDGVSWLERKRMLEGN
jgi:dipeptidyl aminopeptidase/acylaminoacyl peptidase